MAFAPKSTATPAQTIELRIDDISQLFDTLDPFPFRERDLDREAEDYIVGWARELPRRQAISILVHLPRSEAETRQAAELPQALTRYFQYRADTTQRDLRELFRIGRRSLLIGIGVLAACLLIGQLVSGRLGSSYVARFFDESLIILGWVANWRPIEILLYDWMPLSRRLNLFRRLAQANVGLKAIDAQSAPSLG